MTDLKEKIRANIWDNIQRDFLPVLERALLPFSNPDRWSWANNWDCKYVELRIDMRDGGCLIMNKDGKRISPEQLAWQHSSENPKGPDE